MTDVDALVVEALRSADLDATVSVLWPQDWTGAMPLVVAHQVGGGSADPRGIAVAIIDVQAVAATRRDASALARAARLALVDASVTRFSNGDGYFGRVTDLGAGPVEIRTGAPEPLPTFFRFQATYQVVVRPT